MDDFARIRSAIADAAREAWTRLRDERPTDDFYYFGLWTTPVAHRPAPTACSLQGLQRAVKAFRADGVAVEPDELRWAVNASPYDLFGDESFARLEPLFEAQGDPYDRPRPANEALLGAMEGAIADLDAAGFFGVGAERQALVVNVTMPAHERPEDALESARRLNPAGALERYAADLSSFERLGVRRPDRDRRPTT
ncbi:DUF4303 domain-containing protein [Leifsonia sp. 2MCAF36]|uniref:DUF4303 domain-containing protein n=1 Tax=Leifsonia sp. 2MCAF36 TaxID=3232988 RepID=UPI003F97162F